MSAVIRAKTTAKSTHGSYAPKPADGLPADFEPGPDIATVTEAMEHILAAARRAASQAQRRHGVDADDITSTILLTLLEREARDPDFRVDIPSLPGLMKLMANQIATRIRNTDETRALRMARREFAIEAAGMSRDQREAKAREVGIRWGFNNATAAFLDAASAKVVSLDAPVGDAGTTLADLLPSSRDDFDLATLPTTGRGSLWGAISQTFDAPAPSPGQFTENNVTAMRREVSATGAYRLARRWQDEDLSEREELLLFSPWGTMRDAHSRSTSHWDRRQLPDFTTRERIIKVLISIGDINEGKATEAWLSAASAATYVGARPSNPARAGASRATTRLSRPATDIDGFRRRLARCLDGSATPDDRRTLLAAYPKAAAAEADKVIAGLAILERRERGAGHAAWAAAMSQAA